MILIVYYTYINKNRTVLSSVSVFHLYSRLLWCRVAVRTEVHVWPMSISLLAAGSTCVCVLRASRATSATRTWTSVCRLRARSASASTQPAGTGVSVLQGWEVRKPTKIEPLILTKSRFTSAETVSCVRVFGRCNMPGRYQWVWEEAVFPWSPVLQQLWLLWLRPMPQRHAGKRDHMYR